MIDQAVEIKVATLSGKIEAHTQQESRTLLIVGPLPPPVGGGTRTLQVFLSELSTYRNLTIIQVNTAPHHHYQARTQRPIVDTWGRFWRIFHQYMMAIQHADVVLVFAANSFIQTLAPFLLLPAKALRRPIYLKPFGGDLDCFIERQSKIRKKILLLYLYRFNQIFIQTNQAKKRLQALGCHNLTCLPGCRPKLTQTVTDRSATNENSNDCRLLFLSQIRREKGIFVLLDALCLLKQQSDLDANVTVDFYGPIHPAVELEFLKTIEETPNAHYRGLTDAKAVTHLMQHHDLFVLPTFYDGEGHPGVLIEAMQAGMPIVTTHHRAIPELIVDEKNGLLIPPLDAVSLADAIKRLALDSPLRSRMGTANQ
ncbi:MAG: glycosyltransferase family 4 protein, partial [Chloroflexota bacterium]